MPRKLSSEDVSASASESPARRRGPKPLLSVEQEVQLVQWVLARQRAGRRVSRDDVISQAQQLSLRDEEATKPSQPLGLGWCNRFIARYPELNLRSGGQPETKTEVTIITKEENVIFTKEDGALPDALEDQEQGQQGDKVPETLKSLETEDQQVEDAVEPTKSRKYNRKHMEAAVEMYLAGRPMSEVKERFPLLNTRTVRRRVLRVQRGEVDRRRGPRPLLEGEPEQELVAWILETQARGIQVTKQEILARANEQYRALTGGEYGGKILKEGWLRRFKERHPALSGRAPSSVRQEGDEEEKERFTGEDGKRLSCTQASVPAPSQAEEKYSSLEERSSGDESAASAPKRQKTEEKTSASVAKPLRSSSSTRGSILPERRQTEKSGNVRKLDAMMQSSARLEELQRQQLEMLQQLGASTKEMSFLTGKKQNLENATTG